MADDLTGALDVGAEFGKRSIATLVNLDANVDWQNLWSRCDVLALDTESRHIEAGEAARRVTECVRNGTETGATHFFKKTDSTLRGNVGSELAALAIEARRAVFYVAAAPLYGRTTRQGFQYVGDRLLHETEFARDPLDPIETSFVPALLEKQSRVSVRWLTPDALADYPESDFHRPSIVVLDAANEDDLKRITTVLRRTSALQYLAGTARFASHLADCFETGPAPPARIQLPGPILVINGSANERALEQVRWAMERNRFVTVPLPPSVLMPKDGYKSAQADRLLDELDATGSGDLLLFSLSRREELDDYLRAAQREGLHQAHFAAAANLAQFAARILSRKRFGLVVVFGGDTLCALAKALKWTALCPKSEILPGVAVSTTDGEERFLLATKPGGFGPPNVLEIIKNETDCHHDGR